MHAKNMRWCSQFTETFAIFYMVQKLTLVQWCKITNVSQLNPCLWKPWLLSLISFLDKWPTISVQDCQLRKRNCYQVGLNDIFRFYNSLFFLCSRSLFRSGDERGALECYQRASAQYKLAGQLTVQFRYSTGFLKASRSAYSTVRVQYGFPKR